MSAKRQSPRIMMRKEFQRLALLRADEAGILAKSHKEQGAYYLAGYSIECALKACIAKKTRRHQFPLGRDYVTKVYDHNLQELLKVAELQTILESEIRTNQALEINWGVVKDWNVESRYELTGRNGTDMVKAVTARDGVLQWIKRHW
jgi:hypothetical protein